MRTVSFECQSLSEWFRRYENIGNACPSSNAWDRYADQTIRCHRRPEPLHPPIHDGFIGLHIEFELRSPEHDRTQAAAEDARNRLR